MTRSTDAAGLDRRLAVAPMMQRTDRHFRYFMRLLSRHTLLYTEMVSTAALLQGPASRLLQHDPKEHPLALQVGGSDPAHMAKCARLAEAAGFDEVNINVGCPSSRVRSGVFGACLMAKPGLVAQCVEAMANEVSIPITVKTRLGIDHEDSYQSLADFVATVANEGCRVFIVHARKAWLQGLNPKQNRDIPPLHPDRVKRLSLDFPDLEIVLNGGICDLDDAKGHLSAVSGVMIGRAVYRNPYLLATADRCIFGDPHPICDRHQAIAGYLPYVGQQLAAGISLHSLTRPIFGLFQGTPGVKLWRQYLSEGSHKPGAGVATIEQALAKIASIQACKRRDKIRPASPSAGINERARPPRPKTSVERDRESSCNLPR